ncbi:hypothetical protein [Vibrio sp. D431a]|uniref:hypothetical protein n=1 Tax=Vibrio sp. D431a TaxID=2837388 RepID=UPI002556A9C5|nr:hypothetical protein [Vibrio sp. D431a]MDK9789794.1 hypothetical protein [Vibrio sp. D431a]
MRMPSKELAINLAKVLKDDKFAIVENSVVKHLLTGEVIPVEHIMYKRIHNDGIYKLSPATCGGGKNSDCFIGAPSPTCEARSETKCGVYSLYEVNSLKLTVDQIEQLIELEKGTEKND